MADVIMTVNNDKTASINRGYIAVQGEKITVDVNITSELQTLITNNGYSAFVDFLQPDGLSYFKGPYDPTSEMFSLTLGALDSILDKDGFLHWQVLIGTYDSEAGTRTIYWSSKKYRTEILASIGATSSAVLPYVPQMEWPEDYPASNISIEDVGGYYIGATVEDALQQIAATVEGNADDFAMHKADNYFYRQTIYYTSGGTFTKASYPWLKAVRVKLVGGGGGGGGSAACSGSNESSAGSGGSSGGYSEKFILESALSSSETVTVGAAGTGGAGSAGTAGGTTSFGSHLSAAGGSSGAGGSVRTSAVFEENAFGGTATGGDINSRGRNGGAGIILNAGGAGGAMGGEGGSSILGTGGRGRRPGAAGFIDGAVAGGYGSGGGGGAVRGIATASTGGDGTAGIVIVELYG